MPKRKRSEHYVNNKEFLAAIVAYRESVQLADIQGKPRPRITNYLGECFLKIATHLSFKPNFVNYMFKDDMISDGIENCVQYINNFNPEKSQNPFAYFTQIIHYAFLDAMSLPNSSCGNNPPNWFLSTEAIPPPDGGEGGREATI